MLIEIKNDVYFILSRLREIDEDYQIFYNTRRKVFEVHNKAQIGDSYSLTVPYGVLDSRLIELVRKTRVENSKKLFEEIDKQNEQIENKNKKEIVKYAVNIFKNL